MIFQTTPRYYVNKSGTVYWLVGAKKKLRQKKPTKAHHPAYQFSTGEGRKTVTIRLDEIMVETFMKPKAKTPYVIHKDGDLTNCALSNLTLGDMNTLRAYEIERLKKMEPDAQYIPVSNIHDKFTFSNYLVSDTGNVYNLHRQNHIKPFTRPDGRLEVKLVTDQTKNGIPFVKTAYLYSVVYQSYNARRVDPKMIFHINGNIQNDSLENLKLLTPAEAAPLRYDSKNKAARKETAKQGYPKRKSHPPLPPVTADTKWKTIGKLPWKEEEFSGYEVSNMGHVRKKGSTSTLTCFSPSRYTAVAKLKSDTQDGSSNPGRVCHLQVARLVANAFVKGYSLQRCMVAHLNNKYYDNRAENLKWVDLGYSKKNKRSRLVVAYRRDDPTKTKKEYPSMRKAEQGFGVHLRRRYTKGESFEMQVKWGTQQVVAVIQIF
ncbi:hypothetical protein BJV82DRAFT_152307 [Fennellomyces sp. T-0311]|nr:hypothetical protein BJV82DRAFT_152307 [Fennellomyces sp. T-0311]